MSRGKCIKPITILAMIIDYHHYKNFQEASSEDHL